MNFQGANCEACLLRTQREGTPVPSEVRPESIFTIIGEAPGEEEVEQGAPFVGKSGMRITEALAPHGVYRHHLSYVNVLACRPKGNKLDKVMRLLAAENKKRRKVGATPLPSPMECCRSRFINDLRKVKNLNVVPVGKVACASVGIEASLSEVRGGPIDTTTKDGKPLRILPAFHPAHVLRRPSESPAFDADMGRAVRWFRDGKLGWVPPQQIIQPTLEEIKGWWKKHKGRSISFDLESGPKDGYRPEHAKDPLLARVRCWGFYGENESLVIPWLSKDGLRTYYTESERIWIMRWLIEVFADGVTAKASWNGGYYDYMLAEREINDFFAAMREPATTFRLERHTDLILCHRAVASEVSHRLGYAASVYTDVPAWKAARAALTAETDHELYVYNGTDCAVTYKLIAPLMHGVRERNQGTAVKVHHGVQAMCRGLHVNGMLVDQKARRNHDDIQRAIAVTQLRRLRSAAGVPDLNPQSIPQLRALLFDQWNIPVHHYTKGGDPSTDDETVRATLLSLTQIGSKSEEARQHIEFLDGLRRFRKAVKLRGTYLRKFVSWRTPILRDDLEDDDELDEEEADKLGELQHDEDARDAVKRRRKQTRWGILYDDGRVHPDYNAHGPANQRISSSNPNAQNIPRKIRDIFIPQDGFVFVYADMDQLELRMAAAIWGLTKYIEVFRSGTDPHNLSAELIFSERYRVMDPGEEKERLRDFAKRFTYAVIFGAEIETIHDVIVSAEDADGNLPYANNPLAGTQQAYESWISAVPQIKRGWDEELATYQRQHYIAEAVLGFRRDFTNSGGEKDTRNEILNFRCSAGGAGVVHLGTIDYLREVPFQKWGPGTGLINQTHDSLASEVPCRCEPETVLNKKGKKVKKHAASCPAEEVRQIKQRCLCREVTSFQTGKKLPVPFTAEAKIMEHL